MTLHRSRALLGFGPSVFLARSPLRTLLIGALVVVVAPFARGQAGATSARSPSFAADGNEVPDGLSSAEWSSIRAAYEAGRHAAFAMEGGHRARNPGQRWTTEFDGRGFTTTPDTERWTWGLELTNWGRAGGERTSSTPRTVRVDGHRVSYDWDDALTEWYVNDRRGLEHGYTVHARPVGDAPEISFTLAVRGGLAPDVNDDGRSVRFVDGAGATVVTYSGLTVFDADGDLLRADFERRGEGLVLTIDDAGADYPLTIDPVAQQAYLKPSNTGGSDQFGSSVAVSGDTVVVGARREDSNATTVNGNGANDSAGNAGAAYVFVRNGTTWSQQAYLKASNAGAGDEFGTSVAISGDTIVVGATSEDSTAPGVNGNGADNSGSGCGAAYVFVRSGTTWSQQAYLKASLPQSGDDFGISVAISGETVVVGAESEDSGAAGVDGNEADSSAPGAGAAYVFVRNGSTWSQQAYLKASNPGPFDAFGISVSISGDLLVVGAHLEDSIATGVNGDGDDNTASSAGAAYIFERNGATWVQRAYLKGLNTEIGDQFGISVAISGNTVVVGAWNEDSAATGVNGNPNDGSALKAGAAYVFVGSGATWSQQAYLKASNTEADDNFGWSVAISGNTVVVGTRGEDSSATGVNGNAADNSAATAGAVYAFVRNGSMWSPHAYIKASNTDAGDQFGNSVAVSGDTLVVGAWEEDSGATGVNGSQTNTNSNAGAAYAFDLDLLPDPWTNVGSGLAGVNGVPVLAGSGTLVGGEPLSLALTNAKPGSSAALIVGSSTLNAPFLGGTLVPTPNTVVTGLPLDASGALVIGTTMPFGIPSGVQFWVQYWILDPAGPQGASASNGVRGTTP
jgi:hypothetical protein